MGHPLTKFLIFLILLTYSTNILTSAKPNQKVTDKLINAICANTKNKSDCLSNLRTLKGKSLYPNPVAVLGTDYMEKALSRSNALMVWYNYMYLNKPRIESSLKPRYHTCFEKYKEVIAGLHLAKKFMLSGNADSVGSLINTARGKVEFCDKELMMPPKLEVKVFLDANSKFKDICWVIFAICENVRKLK